MKIYDYILCSGSGNRFLLFDTLRSDLSGLNIAAFAAEELHRFGVDGHRELAEAGVTDNIVIPWVFDGLGFEATLAEKKDSLKRFADTYIHSGWQE